MGGRKEPTVDRESVVRLWLHRQGLTQPRGSRALTKKTFVDHLERTGALQVDSVNVLERAHYLTLWSRFGAYDRAKVDRWIARDRAAYEYWGHEASILPLSHLPHSLRRMRRFPGPWRERSWWPRFTTSTASRRRVLRRLREEGPLESADMERQPGEERVLSVWGSSHPIPKEDKRSLKLLWHEGKVAIRTRRHFRCVYDLADRVYPATDAASLADYENGWLLTALSGNGIAPERHVMNYFTAPELKADARRRVIARCLRRKTIVRVAVEGSRGPHYALPEALADLRKLEAPRGTTLICPFDSLLWQRQRAADLLDFEYRVEIYVPPKKRKFGYYVLPILHDGRLVGRLDPKLHRDEGRLEVRSLHLEAGFEPGRAFLDGLRDALQDLSRFVEARDLALPRGWKRKLS